MPDDHQLDMVIMYAFHDALRRDLKEIAQMEAHSDGWDLFESLLHVHHTAEDDALWPVVREKVADRPHDLTLLGDMAEEHGSLGPLLETIDEALGRGDSARKARAELAERLQHHLDHEEQAALPLVDATLSLEEWMQFGQTAAERVGPNMPNYLPWLLDGADDATTTGVLRFIPEPVQQTYREEWRPTYAAKDWWAKA
jgi:iron-sulfur cluster repair protein YtfE (RIC family)